jgi:hypothetical protein
LDIHTIGLVLLEIAYWQPLYEVLGLKRSAIDFEAASRVREYLLENKPNILADLQDKVGEKCCLLVYKCIIAHGDDVSAFSVGEDDDQTKSAVGLKLHEAFLKEGRRDAAGYTSLVGCVVGFTVHLRRIYEVHQERPRTARTTIG